MEWAVLSLTLIKLWETLTRAERIFYNKINPFYPPLKFLNSSQKMPKLKKGLSRFKLHVAQIITLAIHLRPHRVYSLLRVGKWHIINSWNIATPLGISINIRSILMFNNKRGQVVRSNHINYLSLNSKRSIGEKVIQATWIKGERIPLLKLTWNLR
jgi:hypothetical protein